MSAITKADRERFELFKEIGCIACVIEGEYRDQDRRGTPADVHHRLNGYRAGHQQTMPLCPWHHRGIPPMDMGDWQARIVFGPSKAHEPKTFSDWYGSDIELQARTDWELKQLIEQHTKGGTDND